MPPLPKGEARTLPQAFLTLPLRELDAKRPERARIWIRQRKRGEPHAVMYVAALAIGSAAGAVILSPLKKNRTED